MGRVFKPRRSRVRRKFTRCWDSYLLTLHPRAGNPVECLLTRRLLGFLLLGPPLAFLFESRRPLLVCLAFLEQQPVPDDQRHPYDKDDDGPRVWGRAFPFERHAEEQVQGEGRYEESR